MTASIPNTKDKLSELLGYSQQNKRHDIWLWLYLYYDTDAPLSPRSCNGETMRNAIARVLRQKERLIGIIPRKKDNHLLPEQNFDWIGDDKRQYMWLHHEIELMTDLRLPRDLVHLTGKDRLIAMVDIWDINLAKKAYEIEKLHHDWLIHKANDRDFEWFSDKKEGTKRCVCAWEWLEKNYSSMSSRQTPISNYQELLMFFDKKNLSRIEIAAIISKIKGRWSRKQFDERTADKKQINVMLSKAVITQLDDLAKKHGLKRAQIIESLVKLESDAGLYLSDV